MKKEIRCRKAWILCFAVSLVGTPFLVVASDFLPLDVWEEMSDWEEHREPRDQTTIHVKGDPVSMNIDGVDKTKLSFPFNVLRELDDLPGVDKKSFDIHYRGPTEKAHNPYWMPEEYRTP